MKEIKRIDINKIKKDKNQPRKEFDRILIGELAGSILKEGLLEPIKVMKDGEGYILIDGERRLRAYELLSKEDEDFKKIEVIELNPKNRKIVQIISDIHKEKLTPLEEAEAYKDLLDKKFEVQDIANLIGKKSQYISHKLKLMGLNESTRNLIRKKKLPSDLFLNYDFDKVKDAENRICNRLSKEKNLTRARVRDIIISEVEVETLAFNSFLNALEKFKEEVSKFEYGTKEIEVPEIKDKFGRELLDVLKYVKDKYSYIQNITRIKEETIELIHKIESLIRKYGKGAELKKGLISN